MIKPARLVLVLGIVLVMLIAPVLTGCSQTPAPTSAPAPTTAPATQPTAAPQGQPTTAPAPAPTQAPAAQGAKVVNVMLGQEPDTLMPGIGSMLAKEEVLFALWTDLVVLNDKNEYVAWGAESVPTVDNGGAKFVGDGADKHLEVTFKIKKGLKWQDGNPVTSADVKFTIALAQNPDFPAEQRDLALKVADVLTPDDQTAVVQFMSENQAKKAAAEGWKYDNKDFYQGYEQTSGPVLDPLYMTVADYVHLLPSHILSSVDPKDMAKSDFARNPVGNGPYKLKDWVSGQTLVLEAADTALMKPQIPTVVFKLVSDSTAIVNALSAGEGDMTTQIQMDVDQSPELDKLEQQGKIKAYYIPGTAWEHIDFNVQKPGLDDKLVRQAIAYAVDRPTMIDKLLYGKSQPMDTWIAPPSWAIDDAAVAKYPYDPAKAKELLAQAGYKLGSDGVMEKDGQKLKFKLQTTDAKLRMAVAPLIQANLKEVGIAIETEFIPGRGLFETTGPLLSHTFDIGLYTWISNPDPDGVDLYHSKNCPDGANFPCWKNAQFDDLITKAQSSLSEPERKPLYSQAEKIWTDELPSLPLFQRAVVAAATPKLQNFKPTPSNTPETWNINEWVLPAS
ncbi:MAG: peptide ABC transporter substrate-binding protein [Chloroflexota bacterium]